jgi:hypothetical protein
VSIFMSLQTRTAAPGKARRAAKGKPRHTTAQKAARKAVVSKPAARGTAKRSESAKAAATAKPTTRISKSTTSKSTTRYSDREVVTKKEVRLADRSKLRAQRFQERTASKSKHIEGAPKGNPKQSREERTFEKPKKAFKPTSTRPTSKPVSRAAKFVEDRAERASRPFRPDRPERPVQSDTRPTNRREAVKAKIARSEDGRPNFIPQKREKFNPSAPRNASQGKAAPRKAAPSRDSETSQRPARDRRNDSPAYARDDRRASKTHSNAATDLVQMTITFR